MIKAQINVLLLLSILIHEQVQGQVFADLNDNSNTQPPPGNPPAANFPETRSAQANPSNLPSVNVPNLQDEILRQGTSKETVCICVPIGQCQNNTSGPINSNSLPRSNVVSAGAQSPVVTTTSAAKVTRCTSAALQLCCYPGPYQCGVQWPAISGATPPTSGQAYFSQYPWQVVLLDPQNRYLGSGVLIDNLNVVTVAHKVVNYTTTGGLKIRLGEWDSSGNKEPIAAQEFSVTKIWVHPQFNPKNLRFGIALLRISTQVPLGLTSTINTGCLPTSKFVSGTCYVSGWGKNDFNTGTYQSIQKSVDVPLVDQATCQKQLQSTRLGAAFQLDGSSFICAGGQAGKDACTGDGGAPLVCAQDGKFYVAGLVAWGIGCGQSNVPGVYINVQNFVSWIMTYTK